MTALGAAAGSVLAALAGGLVALRFQPLHARIRRVEAGPAIEVQTLGGFRVLLHGQPLPASAWQSRKARTLLKILIARRGRPASAPCATVPRRRGLAAVADEYDNGREALTAIACSETDNPRDPRVWPLAAKLADFATPDFGSPWAYISQACAAWPAFDHDPDAGPFDRKASAPPLLVNARYDAFSSFARAREVAARMPGARLLTVEGPGHTLEGTDSACADRAVERYLIAGELPAKGAVCEQDSAPL